MFMTLSDINFCVRRDMWCVVLAAGPKSSHRLDLVIIVIINTINVVNILLVPDNDMTTELLYLNCRTELIIYLNTVSVFSYNLISTRRAGFRASVPESSYGEWSSLYSGLLVLRLLLHLDTNCAHR